MPSVTSYQCDNNERDTTNNNNGRHPAAHFCPAWLMTLRTQRYAALYGKVGALVHVFVARSDVFLCPNQWTVLGDTSSSTLTILYHSPLFLQWNGL